MSSLLPLHYVNTRKIGKFLTLQSLWMRSFFGMQVHFLKSLMTLIKTNELMPPNKFQIAEQMNVCCFFVFIFEYKLCFWWKTPILLVSMWFLTEWMMTSKSHMHTNTHISCGFVIYLASSLNPATQWESISNSRTKCTFHLDSFVCLFKIQRFQRYARAAKLSEKLFDFAVVWE